MPDAINTICLNGDETKKYQKGDRELEAWLKAKAKEQHAKNGLPTDLYLADGSVAERFNG